MEKFFQVYVENGREQTGLDAIDWIIEAEKLGIGEVILTLYRSRWNKKRI